MAPVAIGISAPGPLDPHTGTLIDPPNLDRSLWDFPLAARIGQELDLPAVLERDTQVAILAEGEFGAGRGLTDYVYLTVSTGIGGAVVSDGRLMRGPDGLAGELGHLTIDIDGPVCGCGARGHLEAIASGTGIAKAMGVGAMRRSWPRSRRLATPLRRQVMERARQAFAAAIVSIVDIFNPQRIIVGGGVALGQGDRLLDPAREAIRRDCVSAPGRPRRAGPGATRGRCRVDWSIVAGRACPSRRSYVSDDRTPAARREPTASRAAGAARTRRRKLSTWLSVNDGDDTNDNQCAAPSQYPARRLLFTGRSHKWLFESASTASGASAASR